MSKLSLEDQVVRSCRRLAVDWAHARRVALLADALYQDTRHLHGLTKTVRPLVAAAALLHDLAAAPAGQARKDQHARRAAEIIPRLEIPALSASDKRTVAAAVGGHRRGLDVGKVLRFLASRPARGEVQVGARIAAILRVADGLDHSRTQGTDVRGILDDETAVEVRVSAGAAGTWSAETAKADAADAQAKADLWGGLFARPMRVVPVPAGEEGARPPADPAEPFGEAVRRILRRQMEQLVSRRYGLAFEGDVEYVHEMRVAARRLRTVLRMPGRRLARPWEPWRDDLSWLASALGEVRDSDVLLEFFQDGFRDAQPAHRPFLRRLVRSERRSRWERLRRLREVFASESCRKLRDDFLARSARPVGAPGGLPGIGPVADVPVWRQASMGLARLQANLEKYGRKLSRLSPDRLHRLRVACKQFRYAAEFFAGVYPPDLPVLAEPMVRMQDLLGEVHDAEVWSERIDRLAGRLRVRPGDAAAVAALVLLHRRLALRKAECFRQASEAWTQATRPRAWEELRRILRSPRRG